MALVETGTRALAGAVFGSQADGEMTWARKLLHLLDATMLLLLDRGFDGGDFLAAAAATKAQFLVRLSSVRRPPALRQLPPDTKFAGITTVKLDRTPTVIAMTPSRPLARLAELTADDLRGQILLVAPKAFLESTPTPAWVNSPGTAIHEVWTVDEDIECVAAGLGIAPLPSSIMADYFARPDIVSVPLQDAQVDLIALWKQSPEKSTLIRGFVECFAEVVHRQAEATA